ncbi:MAG: response regulator transcription factor, partial [Anaerolineae bacterium]
IRVLVADDHAVVRRGLVQILDEAPDMAVVGQASTGQEVLRVVRETDCDVLVLDISMPGGGGLEALKQLRSFRPGLPVLMLSVYPEKQYATRALAAGAAGYLTKEAAPAELVAAVSQVARGETYVSGSLAATLAQRLRPGEPMPHEALSDREFQVMRMLASGRRTTDIASDLSLSAKTVSTYRTRILSKLHLESTADLIRYALDHGLAEM